MIVRLFLFLVLFSGMNSFAQTRLDECQRDLITSKGESAQWSMAYTTLRDSNDLKRRDSIVKSIFVAIGIAAGFPLLWITKKLARRFEHIRPLLMSHKQLLSIILPAIWCSACAVVQTDDAAALHHPIGAMITALLLSAPE